MYDGVQDKKTELLKALAEEKQRNSLDGLFLAVVNIVELRSTLLMCGERERAIGTQAMREGSTLVDDSTLDLGSRVSRKKDFIPPLTAFINEATTKL